MGTSNVWTWTLIDNPPLRQVDSTPKNKNWKHFKSKLKRKETKKGKMKNRIVTALCNNDEVNYVFAWQRQEKYKKNPFDFLSMRGGKEKRT
jgi:hypothetical protein